IGGHVSRSRPRRSQSPIPEIAERVTVGVARTRRVVHDHRSFGKRTSLAGDDFCRWRAVPPRIGLGNNDNRLVDGTFGDRTVVVLHFNLDGVRANGRIRMGDADVGLVLMVSTYEGGSIFPVD